MCHGSVVPVTSCHGRIDRTPLHAPSNHTTITTYSTRLPGVRDAEDVMRDRVKPRDYYNLKNF